MAVCTHRENPEASSSIKTCQPLVVCVCRVSPALSTECPGSRCWHSGTWNLSSHAQHWDHPCPTPLHPTLTHHSWRNSQTTTAFPAARKQQHNSHWSVLKDGDEGSDPAATEFLPDPPCAGLSRAARRQSRSVMRFFTWDLPEWPTFCQNSYKIITQQFSHTDRKNTA